jgi:hypothetical protein
MYLDTYSKLALIFLLVITIDLILKICFINTDRKIFSNKVPYLESLLIKTNYDNNGYFLGFWGLIISNLGNGNTRFFPKKMGLLIKKFLKCHGSIKK